MKHLGFVMLCLVMTFLVGLSTADAQRVGEIDQSTITEVQNLFEQEQHDLKLEIENAAPGVQTDHNEILMDYYYLSLQEWLDEQIGFKVAFKDNIPMLFGSGSGGTTSARSENSSGGFISKAENLHLKSLIDQVNLGDNNNQDILNIFNYLRTLKNS